MGRLMQNGVSGLILLYRKVFYRVLMEYITEQLRLIFFICNLPLLIYFSAKSTVLILGDSVRGIAYI